MYFPILRGRQFELLALRECITGNLLSERVLPIIEPVKASSTFVKTLDSFIRADRRVSVIRNPHVGSFDKDLKKESNQGIKDAVSALMADQHLISALYVDSHLKSFVEQMKEQGLGRENLILICNNPDSIVFYENAIGDAIPLYNLIPDKGDYRRRIRPNRVLCEDHFPKQSRNVDYSGIETEFFSNDHLFYSDDGYKGFSDYSVVGDEYSETGFAPYAVAIHIVFFDDKKTLRIAHFVSDSNDDISDPARKFSEAAKKLVDWNQTMRLDTAGIKAFESAYWSQTYPGLGVLKKYSIMHHLELMSRFLDGAKE